MRIDRRNNSLLHISAYLVSYLERKLGTFGPFSYKLAFGLALGLLSLLGFAKLSEDLLANELLAFDTTVTGYIQNFSSVKMTSIMKEISNLGSPGVLIGIGIVVMLYTGLRRRHFFDTALVPVSLLGGIILNEALKFLFHRQRPDLPHLVAVTGLSFPSGHSMLSYIFYGLLIYLLWLDFPGKRLKWLLTFFLGTTVLAIGISRIYLGVHYPSDVLAGFAAGSFWLVACILSLRGIRYYKARQ